MEYRNLLQLYRSQCERLKKLLMDSDLIGIDEWSFLLQGFYDLEELLGDPLLAEPLDNVQITVQSKIDQFGVAPLVTSLYQEGHSIESIAQRLEIQEVYIDPVDITEWLSTEMNKSIIDRADTKYGSVFDTTYQLQKTLNRLEELAIRVENEENLANFKKTSKYEVVLAVIGEIRKTIKDGHEFTKTIQALQKIDKFQQYVLEEIKQESPECAQRIFKRLTNLGAVFSSMELNGF